MNENLKNIFDESNCLTEEQLRLYVSGKLNSQEQKIVEQHLLDCEMCSDAVEGIRLMKQPEDLQYINEELKGSVHALVNKEEKKIKVLFPWRIAASFALIFVSALLLWIFVPKKSNQELFTQEYKPYPAEAPAPSDLHKSGLSKTTVTEAEPAPPVSIQKQNNTAEQPPVEREEIAQVPSRDVKEEKPVAIRQEEDAKSAVKVAEPAKEKSTTTNEADEVASAKDYDRNAAVQEEVQSTVTYSAPTSFSNKKQIREQGRAIPDSAIQENASIAEKFKINTDFETGMNAYRQGNYADAVRYLDEVKNNPEALFYSAVSYISLDKPEKAIINLQEYRKIKTPPLLEASYWYEALAQLKLNNKTEAKRLLEGVIKFNAEYYDRAKNLLQKL